LITAKHVRAKHVREPVKIEILTELAVCAASHPLDDFSDVDEDRTQLSERK
jgi:hypothetical protein